MPADTNALRVHGLVRFQIIKDAACSPGPGAQSSPVIWLARLSFVHQADYAFGQPCSVIGLIAGWNENRVSPAFGKNLLLPCWPWWRRRQFDAMLGQLGKKGGIKGELDDDRDRSFRIRRNSQRKRDGDTHCWIRGIIHMPGEFFRNDRNVAIRLMCCT